MTTFDDQDTELGFFEEPETAESPRRPGRRAIGRGGGPRRPGGPPSGTVAVARLAGLVVLAIAIIVGLVAAIGGGTNTHGEYSSYMSAVQPLAQSSARAGSSFARELAAPKLTLAGFRAKLAQWSQQEQDDYNKAQQLRPPAGSSPRTSNCSPRSSCARSASPDWRTSWTRRAKTRRPSPRSSRPRRSSSARATSSGASSTGCPRSRR